MKNSPATDFIIILMSSIYYQLEKGDKITFVDKPSPNIYQIKDVKHPDLYTTVIDLEPLEPEHVRS